MDGMAACMMHGYLIESKRREQVSYEAFIEKYPHWEDFHKQREAKRREKR